VPVLTKESQCPLHRPYLVVKLEQHDAQYRQQVVAEPSPAVAPLQPVQFVASEQGLHPLEEAEELILTLARSAEKAG
ncbi:hypothetical protein DYP60_01550, partial [Sphaerochaeta halotolerans]